MERLNFTGKKIFLRKKHFSRLGNDLMNWLNTRERKWGSHKYCLWPVCSCCKQRNGVQGAQQQRAECQGPWKSSPPPDTGPAGQPVCPLRGKGERQASLASLSPEGEGDRARWPKCPLLEDQGRKDRAGEDMETCITQWDFRFYIGW